MNDPHIEKLIYKIVVGENTDYDKASPISDETDDFIMTIDGDGVVFEMKTHCSTPEEAKLVVSTYLKAWEIAIGLEYLPGELGFKFKEAKTIDRNPSNGHRLKADTGRYTMIVGMNATCSISRRKYPSPPKNFIATPLVERIYTRFKEYRLNREKLCPMGFLALDIIEKYALAKNEGFGKKRKLAAECFHVDIEILDTLGRLTSEHGDEMDARKSNAGGVFLKPLNPKEKEWIGAIVKAVIYQVGQYEYDPGKLKQLTMKDLPPLTCP